MRSYRAPEIVTVAPTARLTDSVVERAATTPDAHSFSRKAGELWEQISAAQFHAEVSRLAAGLIAAGIGRGDRVALMCRTRYEWTLADYAIWTAGAITVPVYETSAAEQVAWILSDSEAVAVIVETQRHASLVEQVRTDLPSLRELWQIDAGDLDRLGERGTEVPAATVEERRTSVSADDLATIIYTSGTTGRPRGCELTHHNLLYEGKSVTMAGREVFVGTTLLLLPLAHVFARAIQVSCVLAGIPLGHVPDARNAAPDIAATGPSFLLAVPRVFEKIYNNAQAKANEAGKGKIFAQAADVAAAYSRASESGRVPLKLRARHALFDRLVYGKIRTALGGQLRYAISGGAPLAPHIAHFFRGAGVTVLEGYGLTETSGGITLNLPGAQKIGSVGRPIAGNEVAVTDEGDILLRGPIVFRGYWRQEQATSEALDSDGWLHTGDIGSLDDDGFLTITGRRKELIVTAGGKNVAPALLEDRLRSHPLISQCMVVGDQRPYVACLITVDPDAWPVWKRANGKPADATLADLRDDPDLLAELQAGVEQANSVVSHAEGIKRFRILDTDWTEEGGQITPSLKIKRNVVLAEFAGEIEAIYS